MGRNYLRARSVSAAERLNNLISCDHVESLCCRKFPFARDFLKVCVAHQMTLEFCEVDDSEYHERGFVKNHFRAVVKIGAGRLSDFNFDPNLQREKIGWIVHSDGSEESPNCHSPKTCKVWQDSA